MVPNKIGLQEYDVYVCLKWERERERERGYALHSMVVLLAESPYSLERKVPCPIC